MAILFIPHNSLGVDICLCSIRISFNTFLLRGLLRKISLNIGFSKFYVGGYLFKAHKTLPRLFGTRQCIKEIDNWWGFNSMREILRNLENLQSLAKQLGLASLVSWPGNDLPMLILEPRPTKKKYWYFNKTDEKKNLPLVKTYISDNCDYHLYFVPLLYLFCYTFNTAWVCFSYAHAKIRSTVQIREKRWKSDEIRVKARYSLIQRPMD